MTSTKTVLVLGGSYGGARAARILSETLPEGWRVVVLERNSHMNRESTCWISQASEQTENVSR